MIETDTESRQSIDDSGSPSVAQKRCTAGVCEVAEIDATMFRKTGFPPIGQDAFAGRSMSKSKQART